MDKLVYAFWGCYFGTTVLMLAGSALAFKRGLRRLSFSTALAATVSGFFVIAFLGGFPIADENTLWRFLAHVALLVSMLLAYLLLYMQWGLYEHSARRQKRLVITTFALLLVIGAGLLQQVSPFESLALGLGLAGLLGLMALGLTVLSAYRGDRQAWLAVSGVSSMLLAIVGLGWIAVSHGRAPWPVHAISALAGTAYLVTMAWAVWVRNAYLIEVHQVMRLGPRYDPVTRLRSHAEAGQLLVDAFKRRQQESFGLGVMVITIGNLMALEKLYGMPAVNHALFVSAARLRALVPSRVELGRFSTDGFMLLMPHCNDSGEWVRLAHQVVARLSRPVTLNTRVPEEGEDYAHTRWEAAIGLGVVVVADPQATAPNVLANGRAMSRTAMSYASRVAWFDPASGEAVELPSLGF